MPKHSVLTISRLVPAKGLDRVIEAVSLIRNKVDSHVYLGGGSSAEIQSKEEESTRLQLDEIVKKNKMENRVHFIGFVPHDTNLPAYYRKADIFVLAGRYEPFGLTTLEAMACGTVPIVSDIAGSKEVIIDGLNGFVIDTHDRKALAKIIQKLIEDKELRKKVSENAAFTMREHYAWDKLVDKFINLYKNLI